MISWLATLATVLCIQRYEDQGKAIGLIGSEVQLGGSIPVDNPGCQVGAFSLGKNLETAQNIKIAISG